MMQKQYIDRAADILSRLYQEEIQKVPSVEDAVEVFLAARQPTAQMELMFQLKRLLFLVALMENQLSAPSADLREIRRQLHEAVQLADKKDQTAQNKGKTLLISANQAIHNLDLRLQKENPEYRPVLSGQD